MSKTLRPLLFLVFFCLASCKKESKQIEESLYSPRVQDFRTFSESERNGKNGNLGDLVKGLNFGEFHLDVLRASVVHHLSPDWQPLDKHIGQSEEFKKLSEFFSKLPKVTGTVDCVWDQSLNRGSKLLQKKRVFIAANFKDNHAILPHLLVHLWHTIALLDEGHVFVSIYESSSSDDTGEWLNKYAELFAALKVPHRIKKDGAISHVGGNLVSRIELLSRVRNAAFEPLWDGEWLWPMEESEGHNLTHVHTRKRHPRVKRRLAQLPPTHILFTNDVYACGRDTVRLLYHEADMACGTDWWPQEGMLTFYDIWVARDIQGYRVRWHPPYLNDKRSQERLKEGLHVPMKSCWNGLVVMKAAPFIREGLKFRTSRPGECLASECKLICDDLRELGFTNILMDPGVRLTYEMGHAVDVFKSHRVADIKITNWTEIRSQPIEILEHGDSDASDCCGTDARQTFVDWSRCEHRLDEKRKL